ncbi:MAG: hypothetical protein JRG73_13840 [Deltaproteobacteria bacterium]|nr:hypothetical protein [Deltaproteobacteria bacterium]
MQDAVGYYLSISKTIDVHKGVINECVVELMLSKSRSQPMAAIEIDLETKGAPCGHTNITQPHLFIDGIEVAMQALALGGLEIRAMGFLVMPWFLGGRRLHG